MLPLKIKPDNNHLEPSMNHSIALVFAILVSLSPAALSATAAEKEAEKLLNTVKIEESMERSMQQMLAVQLQQNPAMTPYKEIILNFLRKHMSYKSLKPEWIRIYSESFSADELKEINAFYQTATGQKTIRLLPRLMAEGTKIGMSRVQQNMPELRKQIEAEAEKNQKKQ